MNTYCCRAWGFLFHFQLDKLIKHSWVQELKITCCHLQEWVLSMSFSLRGKVRDIKKKKQTNLPQTPPWNRLKDSTRNVLFFIVVKSAPEHLKQFKSTVRKSDTVPRLCFHFSPQSKSNWATVLPVLAALNITSGPIALTKTQCYVGLLLLFLQNQTKARRVY